MGVVNKVESALRGMVEKPFAWMIRARLNRSEFGPEVERAMESRLRDGPKGRVAPSLYDIYLSGKDYETFSTDHKLVEILSDLVRQLANDRNYFLASEVEIRFLSDPQLHTGQMRVAANFPAESVANRDETVSIAPNDVEKLREEVAREQDRKQNTSLPPAWLTLYRPTRGQPMRLLHSPIRIGRHLSNEIIVNDRRVSRHHAEIRFEREQFILYDLSSTNGVLINGVPIRRPVPLRTNDTITVGSHEFVFQRR